MADADYNQNFGPGGLKTGVGLILDLGDTREVSGVDLTFVGEPTGVSLYVTDKPPTAVADLSPVATETADDRASHGSPRPSGDGPLPGRVADFAPGRGRRVPGLGRRGRGTRCLRSTAPTIRTDAELLSAHVPATTDAFGVLFGRHRDRLWAVALRTMGNPEDAADGLQDGMVAAYRRAGSFRGEAAVTTWLHRVVVNACLDRIRAAKVRRAEPLPDDLEEYGDRGSTMSATDATEDPADVTVRRRAPAAGARGPVHPARGAACGAGARRHGGLPGRRGGGDARLRGGHGEVALLTRAGSARRTPRRT